MKKNECCPNRDYFIAIPASLGGIYLAIVVLFLILAKDQLEQVIPIVWAFVVLGVVALYFAYKSEVANKKGK